MGEAVTISSIGECVVCHRENVALRRMTRVDNGEEQEVCVDEHACCDAWTKLRRRFR